MTAPFHFIDSWGQHYNSERSHGGMSYLSPQESRKRIEANRTINTIASSDENETVLPIEDGQFFADSVR